MSTIQHGRCLAGILHGAWRLDAPQIVDNRIGEIAGLLQDDGLSGLVCNRLAPSQRRTPLGRSFHKAAIGNAVAAARLDDILVGVVAAMRAVGIEPIVTKGWGCSGMWALS